MEAVTLLEVPGFKAFTAASGNKTRARFDGNYRGGLRSARGRLASGWEALRLSASNTALN